MLIIFVIVFLVGGLLLFGFVCMVWKNYIVWVVCELMVFLVVVVLWILIVVWEYIV